MKMIDRIVAAAIIFGVCVHAIFAAELLNDDYSAMTPGMLSSDVIGAHSEYHYVDATAPKGNWVVSCFRTNPSQRAWRLIEENGERLIWQSYTESERERPYSHPLIIAGDDLWGDYAMETKFAVENDGPGRHGVVFRYRTDRKYYFAGVEGQKAVIKKLNDGVAFRVMDEKILAEAPFTWTPGEFIHVKVSAIGDKLTASFNNSVNLEATDDGFKTGNVGLTSDVPTKFGAVLVTASDESKASFEKARDARNAEEAKIQSENPKMVVWKKIYSPGFGVGRNVRFGDLDGDGQIDILYAQQNHHGPHDGHGEVGCLTAVNVDGKRLWQNGIADSWKDHLTNDVGVQIHDIDGDGKNEVIYCRDMKIIIADGATGETKLEAPTPASPSNERWPEKFPRILGDCLYFADFRGLGADRDIIVKDRYRNIWAYNDKLEPMWTLPLNTGHFPYSFDTDGDGKEELACGYSLVGPDGKSIWNLESKLADDHADGVAIVSVKEGAEPLVHVAASDDGYFFADLKGNILKHYQIGHAQNPSIANYRPDLPGLETVVINFWANQGIVTFFDADMNMYHQFEPAQHGSMMLPLNWKGDGTELWILSPNSEEGGAFDGWGRKALKFPADGHPDLCVATLDMTGDARDEIVVWDSWEMWIYTQEDNPKAGKLYKPKRNPLYNMSNYQTTVSEPGWTE